MAKSLVWIFICGRNAPVSACCLSAPATASTVAVVGSYTSSGSGCQGALEVHWSLEPALSGLTHSTTTQPTLRLHDGVISWQPCPASWSEYGCLPFLSYYSSLRRIGPDSGHIYYASPCLSRSGLQRCRRNSLNQISMPQR